MRRVIESALYWLVLNRMAAFAEVGDANLAELDES